MGIACTKLEGFYLSFYYAIEISACKHILTFLRGERGGKREGEGERGRWRNHIYIYMYIEYYFLGHMEVLALLYPWVLNALTFQNQFKGDC